jgi:AcrR family transcriptional regulator
MGMNGRVGGVADTGATEVVFDESRVLDAATQMFYDHGPASVTLKWVALASGVPFEAISSRWPTVESLLAEVLDRLAKGVDQAVVESIDTTPEESDGRGDLIRIYEQVVARSLLDGVNPATLPAGVPLVERLVARWQSTHGLDERTARYRVAQTFALEWGWRLFSPHLLAVCGLDDETEGVPYAELQALHQHIIQLSPL